MGFWLIVLFFMYVGLCIRIYRFVCSKTDSNTIRNLTIVFLILLATWDNLIGIAVFNYHCRKEGGVKIYRTADNVEGYLDYANRYGYISEYKDLVDKKYKFIEVNVDESKQTEGIIRLPNGKYRYSLDKAGSSKCYYFYKDMKNCPNPIYYELFPKEYCMAIEKIDGFKSIYAYDKLQTDRTLYPFFHISKFIGKIWDIQTGEVLGTATSIHYYGGWIAVMVSGFPLIKYPHDNYGKSDIQLDLLYKVLKTNKS